MKKSGNKNLKSGIGLWRSLTALVVVCLMILTATQAGAAASSNMDDNQVLQKSISILQEQAKTLGLGDVNKELILKKINRDNIGQVHVRFTQSHDGIPVYGSQVDVHMDDKGDLLSITGNYRKGISVNVKPAITGEKASEIAVKQFSSTPPNTPDVELMLYPADEKVVLVYRVAIADFGIPKSVVFFVDANSGKMVKSYDDLKTLAVNSQIAAQAGMSQVSSLLEPDYAGVTPAIGTGKSLYSGTVSIDTVLHKNKYYMLDQTKGTGNKIANYMRVNDMNGKTYGSGTIFSDLDNTWGNFLNTDRATAGVDAHLGAGMTWDYFFDNWNRKGIFNDSKGTLSKVHYGNKYNNAFWDGIGMTYGDGDGVVFSPLVSIDVAGHEMSHGVTESVAGLIYSGQSGGLNEAMSDIFGTMVEYYASTHGAATTPDYLVGEDIFTPAVPGDALRYMNDPTNDGYSIDNYLDYYNGMDVHYSSGIANNAFYLLAEGGTHRLGGVVTGIGRNKADKIFFRALDKYMVPSETFSQARAHTIQAATDLYGAGSQEVISVGQAWSAVKVV